MHSCEPLGFISSLNELLPIAWIKELQSLVCISIFLLYNFIKMNCILLVSLEYSGSILPKSRKILDLDLRVSGIQEFKKITPFLLVPTVGPPVTNQSTILQNGFSWPHLMLHWLLQIHKTCWTNKWNAIWDNQAFYIIKSFAGGYFYKHPQDKH